MDVVFRGLTGILEAGIADHVDGNAVRVSDQKRQKGGKRGSHRLKLDHSAVENIRKRMTGEKTIFKDVKYQLQL